jgi:predicted MFS family arabinose efflux permease
LAFVFAPVHGDFLLSVDNRPAGADAGRPGRSRRVAANVPVLASLAPLVINSIVASTFVAGLWTPSAAMIADAADPGARGQAVGVAAMNATWAAGGAAGAPLMAWLADSAGFMLPCVLLGALCTASAAIAPIVYRGVGSGENIDALAERL